MAWTKTLENFADPSLTNAVILRWALIFVCGTVAIVYFRALQANGDLLYFVVVVEEQRDLFGPIKPNDLFGPGLFSFALDPKLILGVSFSPSG